MSQCLQVSISPCLQVSYLKLGSLISNGEKLQRYINIYNGTWRYVGDDVFLEATNTTLIGGVITVGISKGVDRAGKWAGMGLVSY